MQKGFLASSNTKQNKPRKKKEAVQVQPRVQPKVSVIDYSRFDNIGDDDGEDARRSSRGDVSDRIPGTIHCSHSHNP